MMVEGIELFALLFLGSVAGLLGGVFLLFNGNLAKKLNLYSVPFAAGVLLTVSLLGLMPEAVHIGELSAIGEEKVFFWILAAFLGAYFFENFLFGIHHHDHVERKNGFHGEVPLVIFGDTIHNFIDGATIAAAYMVNPGLGLVTALSTFLHEIPHEIADFGILLKAGWNKQKVLWVNIMSSMTTFAGAGIVLWITNDENLVAVLLAVAAGLFLYLGASDFLPEVHEVKKNSWRNLGALLLGVGLMLIIFRLVPHSDESENGYFVSDSNSLANGEEAEVE